MARTKIGSLFADVTLNTKGLDKGIRTAQRKLRLFGRDATMTGKQLMLGIGTPLGIIGGQAVNVFQNFQQEMAKVKAISGASASEFKQLEKNARDLGATTRFTATNVSELQLNFSKLGFTAKEITKVTKATLNLALATGEDLAESARVSAQTLRGFGLEAEQMGRVTDVMAKAFSSSALDLNKFDTAMSIVSATAKSAGISLEQTTGMLGTLVDVGVDASSAGTAMRNVFLELAKQGLTMEQAFKKIQNSTNRNATAMELFGKRGATVGQILALNVEKGAKLQAMLEASGGSAEQMALIMDNTLQGSLFKLKSAFEGVQIELGKRLEPVIIRITNRLAEFLQQNQKAIASFLKSAMKIGVLAIAFGAFLYIAGQVAFVIANIIGVFGFLVKAILMLVAPLAIAVVALKTFGASFLITSFLVFAKGIGAVILIVGTLKGVLESIAGMDMSWGQFMIKTFAFLATAIEVAVKTITTLINKVSDLARTVSNMFMGLFKNNEAKINIIEKIIEQEREQGKFKSSKTYLTNQAKEFEKRAKEAMIRQGRNLHHTDESRRLQAQADALRQQAIYAPKAKNMGRRRKELRAMSDEELLNILGLSPDASSANTENKSGLAGIYEKYYNMITGFSDAFKKAIGGDVAGAVEDLGLKAQFLKDIFKDTEIPPEVEAEIKNIEQAMKDLVAQFYSEQNLSSMEIFFKSMQRGFSDAMDKIKQDTTVTAEEMENVMRMATDGMTSAIQEFINTGKANFKSFINDILLEMQRLVIKKQVVNPLFEFVQAGVSSFLLNQEIKSTMNASAKNAGRLGFELPDMPTYQGQPVNFAQHGAKAMAGQPFIVGEAGAELFVPKTAGTIVPNYHIGSGSKSAVINFNISATDAKSFDQQMTQRRDLIVGMVNQAFNEQGKVGVYG
jgi:hypothetical protein